MFTVRKDMYELRAGDGEGSEANYPLTENSLVSKLFQNLRKKRPTGKHASHLASMGPMTKPCTWQACLPAGHSFTNVLSMNYFISH